MKRSKLFGSRLIEKITTPRTPNVIMFNRYDDLYTYIYEAGDVLDINSIKLLFLQMLSNIKNLQDQITKLSNGGVTPHQNNDAYEVHMLVGISDNTSNMLASKVGDKIYDSAKNKVFIADNNLRYTESVEPNNEYIYIDMSTNLTYRFDGNGLKLIGDGGELSAESIDKQYIDLITQF